MLVLFVSMIKNKEIEKRFNEIFNEKIEFDLFNDACFDLLEIFTKKRLEMLNKLSNDSFFSIRDLAEKLDRDVKNVYEDLCALEKHQMIEFEVKGRAKIPKLKKKVIILRF